MAKADNFFVISYLLCSTSVTQKKIFKCSHTECIGLIGDRILEVCFDYFQHGTVIGWLL